MDKEELERYEEEISYLKYRLGIAEDYITACRSGKNIDTEKIEMAISIRDSIVSMLEKRQVQTENIISNDKQREEEDLLRQRRME